MTDSASPSATRFSHTNGNLGRFVRTASLGVALAVSLITGFLICRSTPAITPLALPAASATSLGGIDFFGACVEGDTFVWCLDRSCSMGWAGEIGVVKTAVSDALVQLSSPQEFSVVTFSDSTSTLSATPLEATPSNVASGLAFVNGYVAAGGTCLSNGVVTAVAIAELGAGEPVVILVGDGAEFCSGGPASPAEVVDAISLANPSMPIHAFYVSASSDGIPTFQAIAAAFGGIFVDTTQPLDQFRRGDVTQDGTIDVADPVALLASGFIPGTDPPACLDAADADDNGEVEFLVDAIVLLQQLFVPGSAPLPPPGSSCGSDPTPDGLLCSGVCP